MTGVAGGVVSVLIMKSIFLPPSPLAPNQPNLRTLFLAFNAHPNFLQLIFVETAHRLYVRKYIIILHLAYAQNLAS